MAQLSNPFRTEFPATFASSQDAPSSQSDGLTDGTAAQSLPEQVQSPVEQARDLLHTHFKGAHIHYATDWPCALNTAMLCLDIGIGDEVIMPALAPASIAYAIKLAGATPVFADIDPGHGLIDAQSVEALLSEKTKLVVISHLYGQIGDHNDLLRLLHDRNIKILEDGSDAFAALTMAARPAGIGDILISCLPGQRSGLDGYPAFIATRSSKHHERLTGWANQALCRRQTDGCDLLPDAPILDLLAELDGNLDVALSQEIQLLMMARPMIDAQIALYDDAFADSSLCPLSQDGITNSARSSYVVTVDPLVKNHLFEKLHKQGFQIYHSYQNLPDSRIFSTKDSTHECENASQRVQSELGLPTGCYLGRREQLFLIEMLKSKLQI